jgi:hypothetical protein
MFAVRVVGSLLRRLLAGGIRSLVGHPISTVIILVLLGIIFLMGSGGIATGGGAVAQASLAAPSGNVSSNITYDSASRPAAAEQYIDGYRTFSAQLIWDAMGSDMKAEAQKNGESIATMQTRMDDAKKTGKSVQSAEFVGLYDLKDGRKIAFYVVIVRDDTNGQFGHTPFTFYIGPDGKLVSVE